MNRRLIQLLPVLLAAATAFGQTLTLTTQTIKEEAIVRSAYSKLSRAVDANNVYQAVRLNSLITHHDLASKIESGGLQFTLGDFRFGSVDDDDFGNTMDSNFPGMGSDGDEIIQTGLATVRERETVDGTATTSASVMASARWDSAPHGSPIGWTMREFRGELESELGVKPLLRYCTYTVHVTFAGKRRTYKAAFFFGEHEKPAPSDGTVGTGGGALAYFATHPLTLDILTKTRFDKNPDVHTFASTAEVRQ